MQHFPPHEQRRRILISPLNWGLGHATRLIPVIDALNKQGHYCILAGESPSIDILKDAFPELPSEALKGFNVKLSQSNRQWIKLLKQTNTLLRAIKKEQQQTQVLIKKHRIDLIISDNRYGVYSKEVASVIITHQTQPYLGSSLRFLRPLSRLITKRLLNQFDECWIPDTKGHKTLSGSLSIPFKSLPTRHLGILSRLAIHQTATNPIQAADVLIILSGPEPHRSQLEEILLKKFMNINLTVVILKAQPRSKARKINNILLLPHCNSSNLKKLIYTSRYIICRSGYSTLMDLMHCGKKAILIPTPGQFEQEYLAKRMVALFGFDTLTQNQLKKAPLQAFLTDQDSSCRSLQFPPFTLPPLPLKQMPNSF